MKIVKSAGCDCFKNLQDRLGGIEDVTFSEYSTYGPTGAPGGFGWFLWLGGSWAFSKSAVQPQRLG